MSTYDDYNDSEQYPTYYSHYSLTESCQPTLDGQLILDRQRRRELFIRENQPAWLVKGQQYRYVRKLMHISHHKLAQCLGLSPSVILAFEEGQPVQRPRFVEGAYLTALTAFFYCHHHKGGYYFNDSDVTLTLKDLVVNLYHYKQLTLDEVSELVKVFKFGFRMYEKNSENWITFHDEFGRPLFSVNIKEEF